MVNDENNWIGLRKQTEARRRRFFLRRLAKNGAVVAGMVVALGLVVALALFVGNGPSH